MQLILSHDHYLDSPAEVRCFETSSRFVNKSDRCNGAVKLTYPGVYRCGKGHIGNLQQGSILVQESVGYPGKQIVLAGVCLYAPTVHRPLTKHIQRARQNLYEWFWSQDRWSSLGGTIIGLKQDLKQANSLIIDAVTAWEAAAKKFQKDVDSRTLYVHCVESLFIGQIKAPYWDGPFRKVSLYYALFPALEK